MIVTVTLEKDDFDAIHDVIYNALGYKPTKEQIQKTWEDLPWEIKGLAVQWGTNDSVFRDNMYAHLK